MTDTIYSDEYIKSRNDPKEKIYYLKRNLELTDNVTTRFFEGVISAEKYAQSKAQREAWRKQIRALEDGKTIS